MKKYSYDGQTSLIWNASPITVFVKSCTITACLQVSLDASDAWLSISFYFGAWYDNIDGLMKWYGELTKGQEWPWLTIWTSGPAWVLLQRIKQVAGQIPITILISVCIPAFSQLTDHLISISINVPFHHTSQMKAKTWMKFAYLRVASLHVSVTIAANASNILFPWACRPSDSSRIINHIARRVLVPATRQLQYQFSDTFLCQHQHWLLHPSSSSASARPINIPSFHLELCWKLV